MLPKPLYGAAFHLGAYDVPPPYDQTTLDQHSYQTLSALYLMAGGSIDTLFSLLDFLGDAYFEGIAQSSKEAFKDAAIATGLAVAKGI
jgi:hypothetical protein